MTPNDPPSEANYSVEDLVKVYTTFDSEKGLSGETTTIVFKQVAGKGNENKFTVSKAVGASVNPGDYYAEFNYIYKDNSGVADSTQDKNFIAKFTIKEDR